MKHLKTFIILITSLNLLACNENFRSTSKEIPAQKPPQSGGTADVGGGNMINGRPIESYRVDPTKLEAYVKILKPKFKAMSQDNDKKESTEKDSEWYFFNSKNWYIAPINLKTLDNKTIGLSFSSDNTQQLAVQTAKEIWIDQRLWDQLSLQDQAMLIAHEYLMMIYLLKFESGISICKKSGFEFTNKVYTCEQLAEITADDVGGWISSPAPEVLRPLQERDYANIRSATTFIMEESGDEINQKFKAKLRALEFDKRLFGNNEHFDIVTNDKQLKTYELFELLNEAIEINLFQSKCVNTISNITSECYIKLNEIVNENNSVMELEVADIKLNIKESATIYDKNKDTTIGLFFSSSGSVFVQSHILVNAFGLGLAKGDTYHEAHLVTKKSFSPFTGLKTEVVGFFVIERVYLGKKEIEAKDGQKIYCENKKYTLNEHGKRKYILFKSKLDDNYNMEKWIETKLTENFNRCGSSLIPSGSN
jgi:hypothetical protein